MGGGGGGPGVCIGITGHYSCGGLGVCIRMMGQYPCGGFGVCISMMYPHPYGGLGGIGIMGQHHCFWGMHWHHGSVPLWVSTPVVVLWYTLASWVNITVFGVCIGIIGQYPCGGLGVYIVEVLGYALASWVCTPVWGLGYALASWVIMWRSWGMYWPLRANIACMHPHLCAGY